MPPATDKPGGRIQDRRPHQPGRCRHPARRCRGRGTVLIATMWILAVLAGMVLVLAGAMRIEGACSANYAAQQQAAAIENGAIQYVLANVDGLSGDVPTEADMPCEGVQVGDGAFWILRPDYEDGREEVYGLVDEASKVNLNFATVEMLSVLPDMTAETAAAVVDWRDADSDLTVGGAESEYYLLLRDPYECKNAPLETVEEVLLVKLASRELLFGEDAKQAAWANGKRGVFLIVFGLLFLVAGIRHFFKRRTDATPSPALED